VRKYSQRKTKLRQRLGTTVSVELIHSQCRHLGFLMVSFANHDNRVRKTFEETLFRQFWWTTFVQIRSHPHHSFWETVHKRCYPLKSGLNEVNFKMAQIQNDFQKSFNPKSWTICWICWDIISSVDVLNITWFWTCIDSRSQYLPSLRTLSDAPPAYVLRNDNIPPNWSSGLHLVYTGLVSQNIMKW
jgi:hypothetical protein